MKDIYSRITEKKDELALAIEPVLHRLAHVHIRMEDNPENSLEIVKDANALFVPLIDLLRVCRGEYVLNNDK